MYKEAHLLSDFRKKISPRLGLEPTKWDKKWVFIWISFPERERKVKLALMHFSTLIFSGQCSDLYIIILPEIMMPSSFLKPWEPLNISYNTHTNDVHVWNLTKIFFAASLFDRLKRRGEKKVQSWFSDFFKAILN